MITPRDIDEALDELRDAPPTYGNAQKLAVMLTLQRLMGDTPAPAAVSHDTGAAIQADSEFLQLALSADPAAVWDLLDEMMETTAVLLPRMYDAVMRRLREM